MIAIAQRDDSAVSSPPCGFPKSATMPVAIVTSATRMTHPTCRGPWAARAGPCAGIGMSASARSGTRIV